MLHTPTAKEHGHKNAMPPQKDSDVHSPFEGQAHRHTRDPTDERDHKHNKGQPPLEGIPM